MMQNKSILQIVSKCALFLCAFSGCVLEASSCPEAPQGPTGPTGATGPAGATGPIGILESDYIFAYSEGQTPLTVGTNVVSFDESYNQGITNSSPNITVSHAGYYLIGWSYSLVNIFDFDVFSGFVDSLLFGYVDYSLTPTLSINGTEFVPSAFPIDTFSGPLPVNHQSFSQQVLVHLDANDFLNLTMNAFYDPNIFSMYLENPSFFILMVAPDPLP